MVNTNWGPGPVNTNWQPGPGLRAGGWEIQTPFFTPKIIRKRGFSEDYYNRIRSLKFAHSDKIELGDKL